MPDRRRIALMGAGAVGAYVIMGLSDKYGDDFMLLARGERKARLERDGLIINGRRYNPRVVEPGDAAAEKLDYLIIALKYTALEGSLEDIAAAVTEDTMVVSIMNGIDSEEIIGARTGMEHMLYALIKIASTRKGNNITFPYPKGENMGIFVGVPGRAVTGAGAGSGAALGNAQGTGSMTGAGGTCSVSFTSSSSVSVTGATVSGMTVTGTSTVSTAFSAVSPDAARDAEEARKQTRARDFKALFDGTEVLCHVSDDILRDMWDKFGLNMALNLPQAVLGAGAGIYEDSTYVDDLSKKLRHEVVVLAGAMGINIKEEFYYNRALKYQRYSTLQDLDAGRKTEIEMLSGAHIRMAKRLGVPCPYNEVMYDLIKALEEKNEGKFDYITE